MTLHWWSHWFWITFSLFASYSFNVMADFSNESLQDESVSSDPKVVDSVNTAATSITPQTVAKTDLNPGTTDFTISIAHNVNGSQNENLAKEAASPTAVDSREAKYIPELVLYHSITSAPESSTSVRSNNEINLTESNPTDFNHGSYLVGDSSNFSVSTHAVPDNSTFVYSVDLESSTEVSNPTPFDSGVNNSSITPTATLSKTNVKSNKSKVYDEKNLKKNITNTINSITLKKILASNKTKQQGLLNISLSNEAPSGSPLKTNDLKESDSSSFQNDAPAVDHDSAVESVKIPLIIPVKNDSEEETFFNSSDMSYNSSAENTSFSLLNERIIAPDGMTFSSFNVIIITAISATVLAVTGVVGALSFIMYRRYHWNKPQTLSDKCSNADSSGYIDDNTLRENSEEMYSLDNDSFLNSLEAMTIQNYWTDVKHTKL